MRIPSDYESKLSLYDTQRAIVLIKNTFEKKLVSSLNLLRVSAPLFVTADSGLNDNLNGYERPVDFDIPFVKSNAQVVHSLAKWKRQALSDYNFWQGKGLYTDMNAIRRDEELDNMHSVYVDQWDWEAVLKDNSRNIETLKNYVNKIVLAIYETNEVLKNAYPELITKIERDVFFITTQELEDMFPSLTPKEREYEITKEHKTVCLMQIGGNLKSGIPHDGRAPDYDDWSLNCDILFYNEVLDCAFEVSSMGIRVDSESMISQLKEKNCMDRAELPFHKKVINNELPNTIGGGIGQSRLCMLLLDKVHIGEVQSSIWDKKTIETCRENNIILL